MKRVNFFMCLLFFISCHKEVDSKTETVVFGYVHYASGGNPVIGSSILVLYYSDVFQYPVVVDSAKTDERGYYELKFRNSSNYYSSDNSHLWQVNAFDPDNRSIVSYGNPNLGAINRIDFNLLP